MYPLGENRIVRPVPTPHRGRWLRPAGALLALHILLLCLPPIPPDLDGSLWSYIAGYTATALLLAALWERRSQIRRDWAGATPGRRRSLGLGTAAGALILSLGLRSAAPATYLRFGDESGLFEPLTLGCYLAAALWLLSATRSLSGAARKHRQLLAAGFALLALEEIDYFGIFGGIFGKPGGVYAGSLHDLIALAGAGVLGPLALGLFALAGVVIAAGLWRAGFLQPKSLAQQLGSREILWVVGAGCLLGAAAALDAHLVRWFGRPSIEEPLELAAAILLLVYSFEVARRAPGEHPAA
jgi:hypothetical protein